MELNSALGHLVGIIGLAGLPREQWSKEDILAFNNARKFAKEQLERAAQEIGKDDSERQHPQTSPGNHGSAPQRPDRQEAQGRVREKGVPLEARAQDLAEPKA